MSGNDHDRLTQRRGALVELMRRLQEEVERSAAHREGLRRYVGVAAGVGSLLLAALNIVDAFGYDAESFSEAILNPGFVFLVLAGAGLLATGLPTRSSLYWLQILIFASAALLIATTAYPGNITSVIFLILAISLSGEFAGKTRIVSTGVPVTILLYAGALALGFHARGPDWLLGTCDALLVVLLVAALYGGVLMHRRAQQRGAAELLESRVRDRTAKLEKALGERVVMLQEIHHRVKNNLQIVASLLRLEANKATSEEVRRPLETSIQRIHTMALIHESLYQSEELRYVELGRYAAELVRSAAAALEIPIEFELRSADRIEVDLDFAIPFGLLLNELVSQTASGVRPDGGVKPIAVCLRHDEGLGLSVETKVPGTIEEVAAEGDLGPTLVDSLVRQLHGRIEHSGPPGASWRVSILRIEPSDIDLPGV